VDKENHIITEDAFFPVLFQQNCENARHIKSERIWFMNIYSMITAGVLSLLHTVNGQRLMQLALLAFMCIFSMIGLLTSFRLKAELEECLTKLRAMAHHAQVGQFFALGDSEGALARYPKFRWVFPVFYSIAISAFVALFAYRAVTANVDGW
jgi:Na+/melibiose symporter-like transporter